MAVRYLKITLVALVGLMAVLYALQNIINLEAAFQVVGIVLGMSGHEYYPASIGPAVTNPMLVWLALIVIIAAELAAGVFALKGAWDLWWCRKAASVGFNGAKRNALLGCGLGVIVWFGFFGALGGAYFQMWQTELGTMSMDGAFQYFASCALILIFVNMPDE